MLLRLTGAQLATCPRLSRALFASRHAVFVRRRGWWALSSPDGLERDQYDRADAVYLLSTRGGRVIAGLRLLPLNGEPMRETVSVVIEPDASLPVGPDIWELTRFFVVKGAAAPGHGRDRLLSALYAYCRERGIRRLLTAVDVRLVPHLKRLGLVVHALAPPRSYAEGIAVALIIDMEPAGPFAALPWSGCRSRFP